MKDEGTALNNKTVVVFDYSGTLSLDAVMFARPDTLTEHLAASGLARVGLHDPEIYWNSVVSPTWDEASTSPGGFAQHLFARARKIAVPQIPDREIEEAAQRFIAAYLQSSRIDPDWKPVLQQLSMDPVVTVIIATDHYAEATGCIMRCLEDMDIEGVSIMDMPGTHDPGAFYIANSAEIGAVKAKRKFWEEVKARLFLHNVDRLLMIDDFGSNESDADRYKDTEKIESRKRSTMQLLLEVFRARIDVFEFVSGAALPDCRLRREFDNLVVSVSAYIEWFIQA